MHSSGKPSSGARRAILVLGPHRSGTSVVTRALLGAGVDLGHKLLEPNDDNPRGFFENKAIVEFNDRLLKALGICWDYIGPAPDTRSDPGKMQGWQAEALQLLRQEFGQTGVIAIKDPRLCLLAPFWHDVLDREGYAIDHVLALRHPMECARSQASRIRKDPAFHYVGADPVEGHLLWARYLAEALRHLAHRGFALAFHDTFLNEPAGAFGRLAHVLQLPASPTAASDFAGSFIEPSLHRHRSAGAPDSPDPHVAVERCATAFAQLQAMNAGALQAGSSCKRVATLLDEALAGADYEATILRIYARARHAAIEANLELAEAKRIIAFQESLIAARERQLDDTRKRVEQIQLQFIAERQRAERLTLEIAARQDNGEGEEGAAGDASGATSFNPGGSRRSDG